MPATKALPIAKITLDPRCSGRVLPPDPRKVQEYYEAVVEGTAEFPPLTVFSDGGSYWLADGRLRLEAWRMAGRAMVECDARPGGLREARLYAASANAAHGMPRTNEDKRRQVWCVLELLDEEGSINSWSATQVAKHCQVGQPLVSALKRQYVELKAKKRREQEEAERKANAPLELPPEEAEAGPEEGFLPSPSPTPVQGATPAAAEPDDEDDDDLDEEDREKARERGYRSLRKSQRFAALLGLTLEELIAEWRADGQDMIEDQRRREEARRKREAEAEAKAAAPARKNPFED